MKEFERCLEKLLPHAIALLVEVFTLMRFVFLIVESIVVLASAAELGCTELPHSYRFVIDEILIDRRS
jgi:hypothetical protein